MEPLTDQPTPSPGDNAPTPLDLIVRLQDLAERGEDLTDDIANIATYWVMGKDTRLDLYRAEDNARAVRNTLRQAISHAEIEYGSGIAPEGYHDRTPGEECPCGITHVPEVAS